MQRRHMPMIDRRYWSGILLASIFGTNLGDLYAHELHLGIWLGTAILALLAGAVFLAERRSAAVTELFYWLVIIVIRTGATNIADYLAFRVHVPKLPLSLGLAALIALFAWLAARGDRAPGTDIMDLPPTGAAYWSAMLSAGVFGTVVGDICSHFVGEGPASLGLAMLLGLALTIWTKASRRSVAIYWLTIAVARIAGTAIGDFIAEDPTLAIGLLISTIITGTAFVAALVFWPRSSNQVTSALT